MSKNQITCYRDAVSYFQGLVFPYQVTFEVYILLEFILVSREHLPQDSIVHLAGMIQNHIEVTESLNNAKILTNLANSFSSDNPLINERQ